MNKNGFSEMNTPARKLILDQVVAAGEPWMGSEPKGGTLRIEDLEGNQAVDTLFYNSVNTDEHECAGNAGRQADFCRWHLGTGALR
jgi:uncharacterized protein YcgI (DUF1989 family)